MSYCPKCGNKVDETMTFCPRCGASLKMEAAGPSPPKPVYRDAKSEKGEKNEKNEPEKREKHEKGEFGYTGWLIGGIVIIIIGFLSLARATNFLPSPYEGALTLLVIGIVVIIVAIWISTKARKRNPRPA